MKLTDQDKQTLRKFGFPESDMEQISEAARRCKYKKDNGEKLSATEVIAILGRENWLSGISRAAFHLTAYRWVSGKGISFDCSAMFK